MININYIKHKSGLHFNRAQIYLKKFYNCNTVIDINIDEHTRLQNNIEKRKIDYLFWYNAFECNFYNFYNYGDLEAYSIWQLSKQIATEMDRRIIDTLSANANKLLTMDKF